ncbi:MAG: DUF2933 domain-containing protein [Alphaproteobacteria bacterium]|nr:DUF2933 domain-containing protein [Alphaproteobacteria bacterium]
MSGRHGSASSGGSGWLAKRRGLIIAGLFIVAAAAFAVSQNWIAFATLLPLLFVLPCAAMMVMCMKGMGNGQQPNANQDQSAGSSDSLGDTRK